MKTIKKNSKVNPTEREIARFVWLLGAVQERYPDVPEPSETGELVLWDRQERQPVMTLHAAYAQAMCLETVGTNIDAPFTCAERFFNNLTNKELASEGLPVSKEGWTR